MGIQMLLSFAIILVTFQDALANNPPPCGRRCKARVYGRKWVYCNKEWKPVTEETCKAVFADETLSICRSSQEFFKNFPGTDIYLWNNGLDPTSYYCAHLPTCSDKSCLCNACEPTKGSCDSGTGPTTPKPSTCKCGIRNKEKSKIVGGQEAIRNEFPWQVYVKMKYLFFP